MLLTSHISRNLAGGEQSERSTYIVSYFPVFSGHTSLPVIDKDVKHAQEGNEETSAPLCLESNGDHDTSS